MDELTQETLVRIVHADHPYCGCAGKIVKREIVIDRLTQTMLTIKFPNGVTTQCGRDYVVLLDDPVKGEWHS